MCGAAIMSDTLARLARARSKARTRGFRIIRNSVWNPSTTGEFSIESMRGDYRPFPDGLEIDELEGAAGRLPDVRAFSDQQLKDYIIGVEIRKKQDAAAIQKRYDDIIKKLEDFRAEFPGPYCLDKTFSNYTPLVLSNHDWISDLHKKFMRSVCKFHFTVPKQYRREHDAMFNINWIEDAISEIIDDNDYVYFTTLSLNKTGSSLYNLYNYVVAISNEKIAISLKSRDWEQLK